MRERGEKDAKGREGGKGLVILEGYRSVVCGFLSLYFYIFFCRCFPCVLVLPVSTSPHL